MELKLTNSCNLLLHNGVHEATLYGPEKAGVFTTDIVIRYHTEITQQTEKKYYGIRIGSTYRAHR